ncbi:MAG: DDE-type integrase/transposase/recombinase [Oligoflexia bacterium]|nr:DDE-type integrase/transposase/recombinase [Oligoflexia bacterium]
MNVDEKLTLLLAVEHSGFKVTEALRRLDIPKTTYYRWRAKMKREGVTGLEDKKPIPKRQWNSLTPSEENMVVSTANQLPELSCREISFYITDNKDFTVSESSVYRILKKKGLIRETSIESFPAGKEYHSKPSYVNEQWQTDATYLHVEGWGWFYLISVLDDYSRKIIAWKIQNSMTAEDFIDVLEVACDKVGLDKSEMPNLVSDRGPALISDDLKDYLNEQNIHHILASPYHPQTNGGLELDRTVVLNIIGIIVAEVAKESKSKKWSEMLKRRFDSEMGPRKDPIYSLI